MQHPSACRLNVINLRDRPGCGAPVPGGRPSAEPGGGRATAPRSGAAWSKYGSFRHPSPGARRSAVLLSDPALARHRMAPGSQGGAWADAVRRMVSTVRQSQNRSGSCWMTRLTVLIWISQPGAGCPMALMIGSVAWSAVL